MFRILLDYKYKKNLSIDKIPINNPISYLTQEPIPYVYI